MNRRYNKRNKRKDEIKNNIIQRQINEIESLKKMISELQVDCDRKEEIINSIGTIRNDFIEILDEINAKKEEYDDLISELTEMRNAINEIVYKKRWKLIRFLMK